LRPRSHLRNAATISLRRRVAATLKRSTRVQYTLAGCRVCRHTRARCVTFHAVGFAVPLLSPARRWSLTPPFHPYLIRTRAFARPRPSAVCSLWHCPSVTRRPKSPAGGWALPTTVPCRARTFLCGQLAVGKPTSRSSAAIAFASPSLLTCQPFSLVHPRPVAGQKCSRPEW